MNFKSRINRGILAVLLNIIVIYSLIASCGEFTTDYINTKIFDYQLQGTWKSKEYDNAVYKGTLVITYNRITINGYSEDQTPLFGSDNNHPFKNFTSRRWVL